METVVVCQTAEGFPVHFDRHAYEADHVLVVNRVKPHTRFAGDIESGLMKMMLIGLGKHEGAKVYHRAIQDYSFEQIIRSVAGEVLGQCRVLAGLAIVENAYDQTARIEAVAPDEFESREKELLVLARRWMPRLPFDRVDVLLVDRIGKNISGTGMDTNVVGRKFNDHQAVDDEWPEVRRIALRKLTPETHGNAVGLGMAEFCRSQLLRDDRLSRPRGSTPSPPATSRPPCRRWTTRPTARCSTRRWRNVGLADPPDARILWIQNTLKLAEVECSAAYLAEARRRDDLEVLTPLRDLPLGADGNLADFASLALRRP